MVSKNFVRIAALAIVLVSLATVPQPAAAHGYYVSEDQSYHYTPSSSPPGGPAFYIHSMGQNDRRAMGQEFKIDGWTPESGFRYSSLDRIAFAASAPAGTGSGADVCLTIYKGAAGGEQVFQMCKEDYQIAGLGSSEPAQGTVPQAMIFTNWGGTDWPKFIESGQKYTFVIDYTKDCSGDGAGCGIQIYYRQFANQDDSYRGGSFARIENIGGAWFNKAPTDMAFRILPNDHSPVVAADPATSIGPTSATLNARNIDTGGTGATIQYKWGLTTNYEMGTSSPISCGEGSSCPYGLTGLRQGRIYHFNVVGTNNAGSQDGLDESFQTLNPAPVVQSFTGPDYGRSNVALEFSASATDPGHNLQLGWDWDGNGAVDQWTTSQDSSVSDTRTHTFTSDGPYNVKVAAQDETGQITWSAPKTVTIDSVDPLFPDIQSTTHPIPDVWSQDNDPILTWTEDDALSGPLGSEHWLTGETPAAPTLHESAGYTNLPDNQYTFNVRVTDKAGNDATDTYGVWIDTTAPTTANPQVLNPSALGANYWYKAPVDLGINGTDATSGIDCEYHSTSSTGPWQPATCVSDHTWTVDVDGSYTFWGKAVDNAGIAREGLDSIDISLDQAPPTITDNQPNLGWINYNPTLDIDFGDGRSGIWKIEYRVYTGSAQTGTQLADWTPIFTAAQNGTMSYLQGWNVNPSHLQQGSNYVTVRVTDRAGHQTTIIDATNIQLDSVAPTMATPDVATGVAGENGWYTSNAGLEIDSNDVTSGVVSEWHTSTGPQGPWTGGAQQDTWTVTNEGTLTWFGRALDAASNEYVSSGVPVSIDKTNPDSGLSAPPPDGSNGWYHDAVTATLTGIDGQSGIQQMRHRVDGGAWSTTLGSSRIIAVSGDGVHTVDFWVKDVSGRVDGSDADSNSEEIKIDTTAPSTSISLSGTLGNNNWYRTAVTATITASDTTSQPERIWYEVDNGGWISVAAGSVQVNVASVGDHTIEYYSVDVSGLADGSQTTPRTKTFRIDSLAPTTTPSVSGTVGSNGWYTTAPVVTLAASDQTGGSGVSTIWYGLDIGGTPTAYTGPITIATDGEHTLRYRAFDFAGNQEVERVLSIDVDMTAPIVSDFTQVPSDLNAGHVGSVRVDVSADPGPSGISTAELRYSVDSGQAWTGWQPMATVSTNLFRFDIAEPSSGWWDHKGLELRYESRFVEGSGLNAATIIDCEGSARSGCDPIQRVAPTVSVLFPTPGAKLSGLETIQWRGQDRDHDTVTYQVLLSSNGGITWESLGSQVVAENGVLNVYSKAFDTTIRDDGANYAVKVQAHDGLYGTESQVVWFSIDNTDPEVEITRPGVGQLCTLNVCVEDPLGETRVVGRVMLAALAEDNGAAPSGIASVEFQIDGVWFPASDADGDGEWTRNWDTMFASLGEHSILARTTDQAGNTALSAPRPVIVIV